MAGAAYYDFFRKITLQPDGVTLEADSTSDTLTITGGNGVAFNPDAITDSFEIDVNYQIYVPIGSTSIHLQDVNANTSAVSLTPGSNIVISRISDNELEIIATVGGASKSISTISATNPVIVTTTSDHSFTEGTEVTITDVVGMIEVNGNEYYMDILTGNTFALYSDPSLTVPVDGTTFTPYSTGGVATADYTSAKAISALVDVTLTSPVENQILIYEGGEWVNSSTFTGNVIGNASSATTATTATTLVTARTISLTGDVTGSVSFNGGADVSIAATIAANSVALGTDTTGNYVAAGATSGNGISGSVSSEGGTFTVTSNATNANTASTIVFRDASGNFSAGTITASLNGNVTGNVTGDLKGSVFGDDSTTIVDGVNGGVYATALRTSETAIALGYLAGDINQADRAIAIGKLAGWSDQGLASIAIGETAGNTTQGETAIAIGYQAGNANQADSTIAIGYQAGQTYQSQYGIAIGAGAGKESQQQDAIAIGRNAGRIGWGIGAGSDTIAIGGLAGYQSQAQYAIAIGYTAGRGGQGQDAIAIGRFAGFDGTISAQLPNSIVINATGNYLPSSSYSGLFIAPINNSASGNNFLTYNTITKEIKHTSTLTGDLNGSVFADDSTVLVDSVNGIINLVNSTTDNLTEGSTNLYYTDARAQTATTGRAIAMSMIFGG